MSNLTQKKCKPCEGGTAPMTEAEVAEALKDVQGWVFENGEITRIFEFKNYYETTAFVNAAVFVAHTEDHHPDISFGYKKCQIKYSTHSIGGISENDFICAAKINALVAA